MDDTDAQAVIGSGTAALAGLPDLRLEQILLLASSRPRMTTAQQGEVRSILRAHGSSIDWGYFIDQAARHGVLPMVGRNLVQLRLTQSEEGRSLVPYRWIYSYAYEGNRQRNLALRDEYAKVLRGLNGVGMSYAIRKGPVLCELVYGDIGVRRMGDLDILMRREDVPVFEALAQDLGYVQGRPTENGERLVPFDRRTNLFWQFNLTHVTLPHLKLAQRDDVELFILDSCLSLFPPGTPVSADADPFLERASATILYGEPAFMLDPVDQFIDICVQMHVEATTPHYIEIGKDLTILKFIDLVELLRRIPAGSYGALAERAHLYECGRSLHYALHHTAMLYPEAVPAELATRFEPADIAYLGQYGGYGGEDPLAWEQGFAERLFDHRSRSAKVHSQVPGPRATV